VDIVAGDFQVAGNHCAIVTPKRRFGADPMFGRVTSAKDNAINILDDCPMWRGSKSKKWAESRTKVAVLNLALV
jgi:hypothetical protein